MFLFVPLLPEYKSTLFFIPIFSCSKNNRSCLFCFLPGAKGYVPSRCKNELKQKDLFLFVPPLPGAKRNVPFSSIFILEQISTLLLSTFLLGVNRSVPFSFKFFMERIETFLFFPISTWTEMICSNLISKRI